MGEKAWLALASLEWLSCFTLFGLPLAFSPKHLFTPQEFAKNSCDHEGIGLIVQLIFVLDP